MSFSPKRVSIFCAMFVVMAFVVVTTSSCALVTTPVEVAGEVAKTGVKVVTYPIRKAVD